MLIREFKTYKDGTKTVEIFEGTFPCSYIPEPNVVSHGSQVFKYEVEHPYMNPALYVNDKGVKFIVPQWIEVHPATTLNDIEWIKPEPKIKKEVFTAVSGSGMGEYKVKFDSVKNYWTCNCQGFYRLKDRSQGCKHIKAVKNKQND